MLTTRTWSKWRIYWQRLVAPSASIEDEEQRQQASLLAGLSLALCSVGTIIAIIWVAANSDFTAAPYIVMGVIITLIIVYILSRTRYFQIGVFLFIAVLLLTIGGIILSAPGSMPERMLVLNFLAIAILEASILLSVRSTLLVASISIIATSTFFFIPTVPFAVTYSYLIFIVVISALLILASVMRNNYMRRLHDSQHRYQALFSQSNDAVFILDPAGRHIESNQSAADMLGYTPEEIVRLSFQDVVASSELSESKKALRQLLLKQSLPIYERVFRTKDGREFPVEVNVELVQDTEGKPLHIQSIVRDITERKQVEAALRASEERFRRLTFNSPDTIYIFNLHTNHVEFINRETFLGYTLEDLQVPNLIMGQVHRDDRVRVRAFWQDLSAGQNKGVKVVDYRLKHKAGHWEWVHNRAIILSQTPDGESVEVLVVLTLITASKQAEEMHRKQEEYLRILFEQTPIGIITIDMTGNVTDANPRSLEILGSPTLSATVGLNVLTLPPLVEAGISAMLSQALFNGELVEMETWYTTIWKKRVFLFIRAVPHFDGQGQQIGLIILVEDSTQRVQAEEGMRQMQKLESLNVLAGGIAHDFNNLLVAMLGQTSLALTKSRPKSPSRPHIEKAVKAAEQAARLTQQLLAYSGRGRFQVAPLDLNTLIEENLHLLAVTIPKQIHLRTKLTEDLPLVEVDVAQMQQVVMNLIINAAEALGDSRGTITIMTGTQTIVDEDYEYWQFTMKPLVEKGYVTLEVHDDGPGMTPETLANIFDPFFTTKEKGHGLGLAAVLGIIKGHQGGLSVYSEVGQGTTFKLLLPVSREYQKTVAAKPSTISNTPNGLILVIDDEAHVREAATDILELENIGVLTAADGQSGLAVYREHQDDIALILLDLSMPGWGGAQTMQELRKINPEVRIILSSGYNEVEATQRFAGKGLTGFLQKPYSADTLLETVKRGWNG